MLKRFLVSVADAVAMQGDNIIFTAKTLLNSSISLDVQSTEIAGGKGNSLQAAFFHSPRFNLTLEDTQFRLEYLALNTGGTITQGGTIWDNEEVVLSGKTGTLQGIPAVVNEGKIFVYVEYQDVNYALPVQMAGSAYTFDVSSTPIEANSTICVSYLNRNANARELIIPANFIPDRVRIFLNADLFGDTTGEGVVGRIQIEIPLAQLTGSQEISMTADGYSTTPLNAMALAYNDSAAVGCSSSAMYAKVTELILNTSWTDGVIGLTIEQGDFELAAGESKTLRVWALKGSSSFLVDNSKLTFASSKQNVATVGANTGIVSANSSATPQDEVMISVKITDKPSIEANAIVTIAE